ncbi:aminopeptidase [Naematelia encephala]|uniref:aspartyl aminopeptidase n=1 Tax=Naematelia encephala TaxID=71784 RepID=A0A1Y2B167_9TREE|nr:aminopeptidase [Naematelia encephala]
MRLAPPPPEAAIKFCDFVTASPTPFQAVKNLSTRLLKAGFTPLSERKIDISSLTPGGKFFYTRNQSSLVAFTLPPKPSNNNSTSPDPAISFAVGHLDSPCLKVRPVSKQQKDGYLQIGVELYGGGTWHTWFDRDLSLAGRVIVSTPTPNGAGGGPSYISKLVKIDRPLLRIPNIAIHLDRTMNDAFKFNKEKELKPVLGLVAEQLNATTTATTTREEKEGRIGNGNGSGPGSRTSTPIPFSGTTWPTEEGEEEKEDVAGMQERHHPMLLAVLADELGCSIGDIQDFELSLYDTQPSCVGGLMNEFVFSPRIDNLMTSFCSIEGLCQAVEAESGPGARDNAETNIRCVILFDNEEVGSISHHGAESNLLPSFVELITSLPGFTLGYNQLLANSFLISADMGHALHPNYADKYEPNHAPRINGGVILKTNANQKYTSNAPTSFLLRRIAKRAGVPVQEFEVRNDSTCGSTVGPHLSTHVRTVDIGLAQLSMHSIRETAGSSDVGSYIRFFEAYFEMFSDIDRDLKID